MTPDETLADDALALSSHAAQTALCLDFDGTLAPIVLDPEASRPIEGVVPLLAALARSYAAVALVSGRPANFLAEHAAAPGVRYFGLYGLQEHHDGTTTVDPALLRGRDAVRAAERDLREAPVVVESGAFIEDKSYSVGLHARRIADPERYLARLETAASTIARTHGLEVERGKLVWELRPHVRGNKGDAIRKVVRESGARRVLVAGDDLGDVPAFEAAAALRADGIEALCVAVWSDEVPEALLAQADRVVNGPAGIFSFLGRLTT